MKIDARELLGKDHAELDALLGEVKAGLTANEGRMVYQKLDLFWARLAMHIRSEHLHLFPSILSIRDVHPALSTIPDTIARLRSDHDLFMHEIARLVKMMRSPVAEHQTFDEAIVSLREIEILMDEHNLIEERDMYPLAKRYLTIGEYNRLRSSIHSELESIPARFRIGGD